MEGQWSCLVCGILYYNTASHHWLIFKLKYQIGIDQDLGDEEADIDDTSTEDFLTQKDDDERIENKLAEEEAKELEETKRERMELIAAEQNALAETSKIGSNASHEEKFEYLMKQSDVFAHFLAGR